jgi:hypothetical protein
MPDVRRRNGKWRVVSVQRHRHNTPVRHPERVGERPLKRSGARSQAGRCSRVAEPFLELGHCPVGGVDIALYLGERDRTASQRSVRVHHRVT